jgi:hypothetical protein
MSDEKKRGAMRRHRIIVLAAALLLGACGGDDDAATTTHAPTTSTTAEPTTSTTVEPTTSDNQPTTTATTASAAAPVIHEVKIDPALPRDGFFYTLPAGTGQVRLMTAADNADRVSYLLVPTGTNVRGLEELIGEATTSDVDGRSWWVYDWAYPDEAILAHLVVEASSSGGTAEQTPFGFYHET